MEILLVVPKYTTSKIITTKKNYDYVFPLGLGYICSVLKSAGYNVDCINLNHLEGRIEDLIKNTLDNKKYDYVCSGHMALGYAVIEKIINAAKNHKSNPKVIIGGLLITTEPELMTKSLKFDVGVVGEGEIVIIELIKCLEEKGDLNKVKGICYLSKEGKPIITKQGKIVEDLDSIPFPDTEALGFEEQLDKMNFGNALLNTFDNARLYHILGSRSCPFKCTFCYHHGKYRMRSIENIVKEIHYAIEKYKINSLYLNDDMFAFNKERVKNFCKEMKNINKELNGNFKWSCQMSVVTADKETLKMLKDSGCVIISLGLESYHPDILKSMKKPITPQQIDNAIKICRELKFPIMGNFIFGDIAETKETAKTTLDYWKKNCDGQTKLFFIHPYPGSEIYNYCIEKGIIKDKLDFIKNKIHHTNIVNMTNMSKKEFKELITEISKTKAKYERYIVPRKIEKTSENRYSVEVECPFCKENIAYKNCSITNKRYYVFPVICRNENCNMRFFISSNLYNFTNKYYQELDFFRKRYLWARDKILRRRL